MASRHHQIAHSGISSGIASGISIALAALFAYAPAHAQTPPPAPAGEVQRKRAKLEHIVFRAFPEADAYSGIKRDITQSQRLAIEQQLPFKVHFNDLGKHELLVAFRGRRPVGLVYCRSEEAEWGLTELAWHMTLDQRLVSFKFLRGRNRHIKSLERSRLATDLGGAGFPQVAKLLAIHEKKDHTQRDTSLVSIERTTLRSAAKVLVVLETVWSDQIETLSDRANGFDLFPAASSFTRHTATVKVDHGGSKQDVQVKVLYAYARDKMFLGCVAWTTGSEGIEQHSLRWAIDRNMRVLVAQPTEDRRSVTLRKACSQLKGRRLSEPPTANLPLSALAAVLGTVVPDLENGGQR